MKKSAHQIWQEAKDQNLNDEQFKAYLKKEAVIVTKESMDNGNPEAKKGSVFLQVGMKVKVENLPRLYFLNAGKEKTITSELENFGSLRAFGLDGDDGIWCIEDFEYCVDYPNLTMR